MAGSEEIDWTGVGQPTNRIEALNPRTFVERLDSMTRALRSMRRLREAFWAQHPEVLRGLSGDPAANGGEWS